VIKGLVKALVERGFKWAADEWFRLAEEHGQLTDEVIKAEDKTMVEAPSISTGRAVPDDLGGKSGEEPDHSAPSGSTPAPHSVATIENKKRIEN